MFKLLFKNMRPRQWVAVVVIFILTFGQVFFMMQIVGYISLLTGAVGAKAEAEIWWYGLYMIICAILMAAVEIIIRFVASATASGTVTNLREKILWAIGACSMVNERTCLLQHWNRKRKPNRIVSICKWISRISSQR